VSLPGSLPEGAIFQLVSGGYFSTLGVRPALGRLFTDEDDRISGDHPIAVMSHGYWTRRWSQRMDVLGSVVHLNGQALTIVGVTGPGFTGTSTGDSTDLWVPAAMQWNVRHFDNVSSFGSADTTKPWLPQENVFWLKLIARLPSNTKPNSTVAALDAVLKTALAQVFGNEPDPEAKRRRLSGQITLAPCARGLGRFRNQLLTPLIALMTMSGIVLLIGCANLACLQMARAQSRQREIAVRLSLGAHRFRLIRQLLTESLLLALLGSLGGFLLGAQVGPALLSLLSGGRVPMDLSPNLPVLAFSVGLCVLTTVLFGLVPSLRSTRVDLVPALKVTSAVSRTQFGLAQAMVSAEVALSIVLLVSAGLLGKTLNNLLSVELGYQATHLLSVQIDPRLGGYRRTDLLALYSRLEDRIRALPGVRSVSVSLCSLATGSGCGQYSGMYAEGFVPQRGQNVQVQELFVGKDYLQTIGLPLIGGRSFTERDVAGSERVILVNQTFARYYFGHENVTGRRAGYGFTNPTQFTIVGVVRDTPVNNLRESVPRFVLHPVSQEPTYLRNIDVSAYGDPAALASAVRSAIQVMEPNLTVRSIRTMTEQVNRTLTQEHAVAWLSGLFSALATVLACLGLYGLLSYKVSNQTREIGIRMALGAERASVQWLVVRDALLLTFIGVTIGLALSLATTRFLRSLLFGLSSTDAATYLTVALVLTGFALIASLLPARRASKVDPMVALRYE
jgi:predicted permease